MRDGNAPPVPPGKRPRREPSDVRPFGLLVFSVSLLLVVGGIMVAAKVVLDRLVASRPRPVVPLAAVGPAELPPEPRLQSSPTLELNELRAREDQEMSGYRWVDRSAGIIEIPVDRALELVAARGLPAWKAPAAAAATPTGAGGGKERRR
jgi:hypothetical protein